MQFSNRFGLRHKKKAEKSQILGLLAQYQPEK
jgi:hypothetical protein